MSKFPDIKKSLMYSISVFAVAILFSVPIAAFAAQNSASFSSAINLSNDSNNAQYPMIANSGNNVYVVWTEESHGIFFRMSPDGGSTWTPPISSPATKLSLSGGTPAYPVITANGSNVYVAWSQTVNKISQIYFTVSTNYGAIGSFSAPTIVDTSATTAAITPVLAGYGSDIYIAWSAGTHSFERSSVDAGSSWGPVNQLGTGHEPQLAAWGTYAYFISDGISYKYSTDSGSTWHSVNLNTGSGAEPWIAAAGANVYVAWEQKGTNKTAPIYGEVSNNYGVKFTAKEVLSGSVVNSWEPQLAASGNDVYLAFRSLTPPSAWITSSSNAGLNWNPPTELSTSGRSTGWPLDVAVSGSNVFTIYGSAISSGSSVWNAYASYSPDSGTTWSSKPGLDLSGNTAGVAAPATDVASASIGANGATGFAAWQSNQSGQNQIYFA